MEGKGRELLQTETGRLSFSRPVTVCLSELVCLFLPPSLPLSVSLSVSLSPSDPLITMDESSASLLGVPLQAVCEA